MKLCLVVLLVCLSPISTACKQPVVFQVGAYVSIAFINQIFSTFIEAVSSEIDCQIHIQTSASHKDHVRKIINRQGDIYITPAHFAQTLSKHNFQVIAVSDKTFQIYIVTRDKTAAMGELHKLAGQTIFTPGAFTMSHTFLMKKLKENHLLDSTKRIISASYSSNTLKLLKGKANAAVTINYVYDKLPKNIQQNLSIIAKSTFGSTNLITHISIDPKLTKAIDKHLDKISILNWVSHSGELKPTDPSDSDAFERELHTLLNEK